MFSTSRVGATESQHSLLRESTSSPTNHSPTRLHKRDPSLPTFSNQETGHSTPLAPPPLRANDGFARPPSSAGSGQGSRPGSRATSPQSTGSRSRPTTPSITIAGADDRPQTPNSAKPIKRKSWLPGSRDKAKQDDKKQSKAWIAGLKDHVPYDVTPLLAGEELQELWNGKGDTLIYLFPSSTGRGASFKVDSALLADSQPLMQLRMHSQVTSSVPTDAYLDIQSVHDRLSRMSTSPTSPPNGDYRGAQASARSSYNFSAPSANFGVREERHLFLPLQLENDYSSLDRIPQGDDFELMILYRNFFAYLIGGALVSTSRQVGLYSVFTGISSILRRFGFTDADGSTWGSVPSNSFARYCQELRLADVRSSREKTIEALVLGEQMRFWPLYNEGFVHAAGRLDDIKFIKSAKMSKVSPITVNRLERAHLDIDQRLMTVSHKLDDFDFPSMFSGIANSQTSAESKLVRFKAWKASFLDFRRFTMSFYRRKYGAWPPKASSKKNNFEESGLNRVLLQELYNDFTDLYDMLVDRNNLTTRTVDVAPLADDAEASDNNETIQHALRRVESEYDRATPPVVPPIPFDVPIVPGFANSFSRVHVMATKSTLNMKRLKENEVNEILLGSYNREGMKGSPWIQDFLNYERSINKGKTIEEMIDNRCGQWLFMYAVLQSLPMTVVDARDVTYKEGVEYFLCVAPRGGRPWMKEDTSQSRSWYNVASGGGMVSLPADMIDHSVEGVYRRSHCWLVGAKWANEGGLFNEQSLPPPSMQPPPRVSTPPLQRQVLSQSPRISPSPRMSPSGSPLLMPMSALEPRSASRSSDRSSFTLGLDPASAPPERSTRPVSVLNPSVTFDSILSSPDQGKRGRKSKK